MTSLSVAGESAGAEAVRCAASTKDTPVAVTPPTCTAAPARKFAPAIVTPVPPAEGPELGLMLETDGPGRGVGVGVGVRVRERSGGCRCPRGRRRQSASACPRRRTVAVYVVSVGGVEMS